MEKVPLVLYLQKVSMICYYILYIEPLIYFNIVVNCEVTACIFNTELFRILCTSCVFPNTIFILVYIITVGISIN